MKEELNESREKIPIKPPWRVPLTIAAVGEQRAEVGSGFHPLFHLLQIGDGDEQLLSDVQDVSAAVRLETAKLRKTKSEKRWYARAFPRVGDRTPQVYTDAQEQLTCILCRSRTKAGILDGAMARAPSGNSISMSYLPFSIVPDV